MRFPEGHWGPQWCHDQMAVRYGQTVPLEGEDLDLSWVEYHLCDHADDVRAGCVVVAREVNGGD